MNTVRKHESVFAAVSLRISLKDKKHLMQANDHFWPSPNYCTTPLPIIHLGRKQSIKLRLHWKRITLHANLNQSPTINASSLMLPTMQLPLAVRTSDMTERERSTMHTATCLMLRWICCRFIIEVMTMWTHTIIRSKSRPRPTTNRPPRRANMWEISLRLQITCEKQKLCRRLWHSAIGASQALVHNRN